MASRRIRWLSASRQAVLQSALSSELRMWHEGWSVGPEVFVLEPAPLPAIQPTGWRWFRASGVGGMLVFGGRAAHLDGLGPRLAGSAIEDSLDLGRRVGRRALQSLLASWAAESGVTITEIDSPGSSPWRSDAGGASFKLSGDQFDARLLVDDSMCDHWAPPSSTVKPTLTPRLALVGAEGLELDVLLDLGETSLSDTQGLQVGDVLVSRTSIDAAFGLHMSGTRVAAARLRSRGGRRALLIDSPTVKT